MPVLTVPIAQYIINLIPRIGIILVAHVVVVTEKYKFDIRLVFGAIRING